MHELSVAVNIINLAEEAAKRADAKRIHSIELEIGALAGIDFDALEFAMDVSVKGTMLENAERKYTKIETVARCLDCKNEFPAIGFIDNCPECNSFRFDILKGKELLIRSLEIEANSSDKKEAEFS